MLNEFNLQVSFLILLMWPFSGGDFISQVDTEISLKLRNRII